MATRGARVIALLLLLAPACDGRATPLRARGRPPRAGAVAVAGGGPPPPPRLSLRQHALAGAFARAVAQSCVHPLNVAKTTLQTANGPAALRAMTSGGLFSMATWRHLSRGLGAQALLSMPNGAINFCVMEGTRRFICSVAPRGGALIDATTAAAGTAVATVVSLPQSILNDRIMGGAHQNLVEALRAVGWRGLYPRTAWTAALCAKVPAYAVNWAAYQGLRRSLSRKGKKLGARADVLIGACAASASVCLMIPLDTVKVRMTTGNLGGVAYRNVADAIRTMLREEGAFAFYRGLPPRLLSVVPMIAIQFATYEFAKRRLPALEARLSEMIRTPFVEDASQEKLAAI